MDSTRKAESTEERNQEGIEETRNHEFAIA